MKKKKTFILAIVLTVFGSIFSGCSSEEEVVLDYSKTLMNGYESYDELQKTNMQDMYQMYANASLCTEKEYVREGKSSMKLEMDFTSNLASRDGNVCGFKYSMNDYDRSFGRIDKIYEFGMDIYNADDREYTMHLVAIGASDTILFTDGANLTMNSWNHVRFQFKPWFFEEDTTIEEYRIYIEGVTGTDDLTATLYIDNVAIYTGDNAIPKIQNAHTSGSKKELLDFDDVGDADAVMTKSNFASWAYIPRFYTSYDASVQVGETSGALAARIDRSSTWGMGYVMGNGYDICLHETVTEKAQGAKALSVVCRNESQSERQVSLIVVSNEKEYAQTVYIESGATQTITLDVGELSVDDIKIRIDSWKLSEEGLLYFADLRCEF